MICKVAAMKLTVQEVGPEILRNLTLLASVGAICPKPKIETRDGFWFSLTSGAWCASISK